MSFSIPSPAPVPRLLRPFVAGEVRCLSRSSKNISAQQSVAQKLRLQNTEKIVTRRSSTLLQEWIHLEPPIVFPKNPGQSRRVIKLQRVLVYPRKGKRRFIPGAKSQNEKFIEYTARVSDQPPFCFGSLLAGMLVLLTVRRPDRVAL